MNHNNKSLVHIVCSTKQRRIRAEKIQHLLDQYIPDPQISLSHINPFTLLIAVLLSAQCTDKKVNQITPSLFERAATPQQMISLSLDEIRHIIYPCGLYITKAKNIWLLSHILLQKYDGEVPCSFDELQKLPGVGRKTAAVVLSQAFNIPAFAVDTHILRCAVRWGLSDGPKVEDVEKDMKRLYDPSQWGKIHLQIILYARQFCPARKHILSSCPICHMLEQTCLTAN